MFFFFYVLPKNAEIYSEETTCEYVRTNVTASMTPKSGLYWLRDKYGRQYPTYCDFDNFGRSWTLVASVHDNKMGIDGRCSPGDRWSTDVDGKGTTPWSDESVFGDVTSLTSADYKNAGYFSARAENIMIWQVREHTSLDDVKEQSYLRLVS